MNFIANNITTALAYAFLYLTVILLWVPKLKKIPLWTLALATSTTFGLISNRVDVGSVFLILLLVMFSYYLGNPKKSILIRVLSGVALFCLGAGLETHIFSGFQNLIVIDHAKISKDGVPFSLYLNFDKTVVGIIILGVLHQLIAKKIEWLRMFKSTIPITFLLIVILIFLSFFFKYIHFDPKQPDSLLIWSCTNLLFVCIAEEGFFRGFIQKYLCEGFRCMKQGNLLAIIISSILFGVAHYSGGLLYVVLATISGMGYGLIYFRTKRIESSIIAHFSLNLVHFLFFTYPALAVTVLG